MLVVQPDSSQRWVVAASAVSTWTASPAQLASYHLAVGQTGIVVEVARTELAGVAAVGTEVGETSVRRSDLACTPAAAVLAASVACE